MADQFDTFLAAALTPPSRDADRQFVARVQARVALEKRLQAERSSIVRRLATEMLALVAVAAALVWLGSADPIADFTSDTPWLAACVLLSGFGLFLVAVGSNGSGRSLSFLNER